MLNYRILMCFSSLVSEEEAGRGGEGRGEGWSWGGKAEQTGVPRIHAVAARPHCRLTLTVPGDARDGE